jgi:hypothetical protein
MSGRGLNSGGMGNRERHERDTSGEGAFIATGACGNLRVAQTALAMTAEQGEEANSEMKERCRPFMGNGLGNHHHPQAVAVFCHISTRRGGAWFAGRVPITGNNTRCQNLALG